MAGERLCVRPRQVRIFVEPRDASAPATLVPPD